MNTPQLSSVRTLTAPTLSFTPVRSGLLQSKCACGGTPRPTGECEECSKKRLQRKTWNSERETRDESSVPSIVHEVLRSPGQPLDQATRAFMEPRFGHDFSKVRVHADAKAADSARAVNALAYTVGHNVVFGVEQYKPNSHEGRGLLAHELTHVVQQQVLTAPPEQTLVKSEIGAGQDTLDEREASNVSNRIMASDSVTVLHRAQAGTLQKAAPAVAAVGIGALAAKCIIGAIIGVLVDLGIQGAIHAWRARTWRFWEMTVDLCSVILSAILGCIGGAVAAKWIEPWLNSALGTRLGGIAGSLIGKILIFIANKLAIGVPRAMVKTLLKLNCISNDQAEILAPGVSHAMAVTAAEEPAAGTASEEEAVA